MWGRHKLRKLLVYGLVGLVLALGLATCNRSDPSSSNPATPTPTPTPLPAVAELPDPELPDWIEQISPTGEAEALAQIRIRFAEPLVAVESLESPERNATLEKFQVFPDIPGQFRFLTPRMVGFQADRAIPKATRIRVTLKAGLADLADHQLADDLAWTFTTEPIRLTNLPGREGRRGSEGNPIDLEPTLEFQANLPLDLASLRSHLSLTAAEAETSVPVRVVAADYEADPTPQERFDATARPWIYHVTPERPLDQATRYFLSITPGLKPAGGNLATTSSIDSQVMTYAPLSFNGLEQVGAGSSGGPAGRFVNGLAQLSFNNGLVAAAAEEHITIDPPPKEGTRLVRAYDNEAQVSLNPWALQPNTPYTVTLGADLEDRFGQTLGEAVTVDYTPGDLSADLWAPSGLNIFPARQELQLNLSAVNLPDGAYRAAYQVVQPSDLVQTDSAYPRSDRPSLLPDQSTWSAFPIQAEKNAITDIAVPLREQLGGNTGMLAYGITARTVPYTDDNGEQRWRSSDYYGLVQLTNLGVFAQWFPESGQVRVHHLADGAPVGGAPVTIYRSYLYGDNPPTGQPQPCASGTTAANGTLQLTAADLQTCMAGAPGFQDPPELLVVAEEGDDWAFVRTLPYSGTYGYGIYGGWDGTQPQSRGTVFSDRFLYQPGETAWLTGNAYYLQRGDLRPDPNTPYSLTLTGPEGNEIDLGTHTTNEFGTFSLSWPVGPDQPLGYYSILARADSGVELRGELRVAEFKPPNFQVDLALDSAFVTAGDALQAQVESRYLFGAPVQGGDLAYYVTRQPTQITPEGWDDFSFGRQWYWPEERPSVPSDVLETRQTLSDQGQSQLSVEVAADLPYPMTYRVDAEVVDVSNLSVASSQTVTALPGERLIGLKSRFVADAGTSFDVDVAVTDPQGQAQPGQSVQLTLERINYSSVTEVVEGSATPNYQVEYEPVDEASVRSGREAKTVQLQATEAGPYRIRATFANGDERLATDTRIWVTGSSPVYWGSRYDDNRLDVQLDKQRYAPGETATALIQSPYEAGELYFAVVRQGVLYEETVAISGGAPQVQFTVTPDMLPNAAVEAVLVRQGPPLETVEPSRLENLVGIGFAPFNVDLSQRYLTPDITPDQAELPPAAEQTLELTLKDDRGQPVRGQFTVMVVDEAVLQLSGHRPPDLVETVYADQAISTRFADNRPDVVLQPLSSPLAKGWGYGGGFSAGGESTRIREDFQALAYYNGALITDDQGRATVSFTLPDNLTTWRVMVVATDGNLRFGNGEATFVATQPLITTPVLPQFARPGDRLMAGLSVTHTGDRRGQLQIRGQVGAGLTFADGEEGSLDARAPEGTQAYRFPMEVTQAGEASVQFQTQLGEADDGFRVSLPVRPLEITEQVVEAGSTAESVTIPLRVGDEVVPDVGGLQLALSSTLLSDIKAPVQQLEWQAALPNLSTAASQLSIAAHLQMLSRQYGQVVAGLNAQWASEALQRIQPLQRPDGGLASWPGFERSDPFVSAYGARALAAAQAAEFNVDGAVLSQLQRYLSDILTNPGQVEGCDADLCKRQVRLAALGALAELGDLRQDFLADLYEQRQQLDDVGRIRLAQHLARFDDWQSEADALARQIQESVYETARSATVNLPSGWGWFHSPVTAQAQTLQLFVTRNADAELLGRLVEGLLSLRRQGTWQTAYDNAQALGALVAYAQLLPEPPSFETTVQLAGETLASQSFQGYGQPSLEVSVPMADLPDGESELVLEKSGSGTLHYLSAYRYRLQGNPPGRLQGLRVTRTVRPANEAQVLYRLGLRAADESLALPVGQVFDVGLEIITDHPVNHVVITDPLPAGLEAVDTAFQTSTSYFQPQQDSWEVGYQRLGSDQILAYGDHLEAGVYTLHYLVRSVTPGTFLWPGSQVQLEYAPEEFGRAATATLEVVD